MRGENNTY